MLKDISVIAFDIDGTLYPSYSLNIRIVAYFLRHLRFYISYNKARRVLHRSAPLPDFYEYQSRVLADYLKCNPEKSKKLIQDIVYDGLKKYFTKVKPFKGVKEVLPQLKAAGYRLAILSDFPPEQKGDLWGLYSLFDVVLGSEQCGALKPSKYPFGILARTLNVKEENILYVGNSVKYDVRGSKGAGMKSALIVPWWKKLFHLSNREADICFTSYRQLAHIVLQ